MTKRFIGFNDVIRKQPLVSYLVLTFAFTWSVLPLAAKSIPVSLIALCGPAFAALIITTIDDDRRSQRLFYARLRHWRLPIRWWLLALLMPLPITALRSSVEYLCGADGAIQIQPILGLNLLVFFLVAGEEIGWRGFALPRLLPRFGPWKSSAIVGIVWGFWHLPLFFMESMPQYQRSFLAFAIYTISLSLILTCLSLKTQGSVIVATLFHGAVNTLGLINEEAGATLRDWCNALSYGVTALLIGVVTLECKLTNSEPSN